MKTQEELLKEITMYSPEVGKMCASVTQLLEDISQVLASENVPNFIKEFASKVGDSIVDLCKASPVNTECSKTIDGALAKELAMKGYTVCNISADKDIGVSYKDGSFRVFLLSNPNKWETLTTEEAVIPFSCNGWIVV